MSIDWSLKITDIATALIALAGVVIAGIGLGTWKKQIKGTTEYELAKRLLLDAYRLRDALVAARNPFLSVNEGDKDDTEDTWQITAYGKRWDKVLETINQFKTSSLEAEVVWGPKTTLLKKELLSYAGELYAAIDMFIHQKRDSRFSDDFHKLYDDVIYEKNDNDDFNKKLNGSVKKYEIFLKPHLKK